MKGPHIDHNDCVLRYKIPLIPIILNNIVILAKFIYWTPSEDFLPTSIKGLFEDGKNLDDRTDVRKLRLIFESRCAI
jgi:hypothetical protein